MALVASVVDCKVAGNPNHFGSIEIKAFEYLEWFICWWH